MPAAEHPSTSLIPSLGLRYRLTRPWARVVIGGWTLISLGLVSVAISSQIIGRPVWWIDDQRFATTTLAIWLIAVFTLPLGVTLWSVFSGPGVPVLSVIATLELVLLALVERHSSPGAAVVLGALAVSALLLSVASFAGLHRTVRTEVRTGVRAAGEHQLQSSDQV